MHFHGGFKYNRMAHGVGVVSHVPRLTDTACPQRRPQPRALVALQVLANRCPEFVVAGVVEELG